MLITKWVEKVGYAVEVGGPQKVAILAISPAHLEHFLEEKFNPKEHDAALCVRFKNSKFVLFLYNHADCPMHDIIDPCTGKYLIKYGEWKGEECLVKIQ